MAGLVQKQGNKKVAGAKDMNVFPKAKGKGAKVVANKPGKTGK